MSARPILYYVPGSPPVRSVLLVANAINLDLDLKLVNLAAGEQREPWYLQINPQHTVPTLVETDGRSLWDSHAICTYLIDKYGGANGDHPLYPRDLFTRARIEQRLHFEGTIIFSAGRAYISAVFLNGLWEPTAEHTAGVHAAFDLLEIFLATDPYLVGDQLTVADLSTVTTVTQVATQIPLDVVKHVKVLAWIKRLEQQLPYFHEINTKNMEQFMVLFEGVKQKNKAAAAEKK